MIDYVIRDWKLGDEPALRGLFEVGFGDDGDFIDAFFAQYLKPGCCLVAEADGQVVSAMYILPGEALYFYRKHVLTAGYTYALATLPAYRGHGIGTAVYRACCERVLETADCACVLPSGPELYPLYENANGANPLSFVREARISREELRGVPTSMAARLPAYQYAGMRESLLSGLPHAAFDADLLELMEQAGCEFFVMEEGAAAAETIDGVCYVRELLAPNLDGMSAVASVARWCPAKEYVVRTPLFYDGPGEARKFVLGVMKQTPNYPLPDDFWWPFGLE